MQIIITTFRKFLKMALGQQLSEIISLVDQSLTIPDARNYWLVRTLGGSLYDSFVKHGFIAMEYEEIGLSKIASLRKDSINDYDFINQLKDESARVYPDRENSHGIIANQISKFVYDIKKDDIVIIPSSGGYALSFGVVTDSIIPELTDTQMAITGCTYTKRKKIRWIKEILKDKIDPYLWKMLGSRMALSSVSNYGSVIERSLNNFFVTTEEGHLVLNVKTQEQISAYELFETGFYLLKFAKDVYAGYGFELDVQSIDLKINLNSEGKMHFKAPHTRTVFLIAILVVAINGGGLKIDKLGLDLSTDGFLKNLTEYQNNAHDREMKDSLQKNLKHLKIESPNDAVTLLQQLSDNKNKPK